MARGSKPQPEEELLNAVHALIVKMFKTPAMVLDLVPPLLQATIERVCKKFFVAELIPSITQRKHIAFVQKYKAAFEADFLPVHAAPVVVDGVPTGATHAVPNPRFPSTLTQLIHRLKRWKAHLQFVVGTGAHVDLQLEKLSPYLSKFHSWDIEIPGQYIHDREPNHEQHLLLQRFSTRVSVHHSHGFSNRRIGMLSDDGRPHHFLVQYQISHITRSDERMMQLYVLLNRMMRHYKVHSHTGTRTDFSFARRCSRPQADVRSTP